MAQTRDAAPPCRITLTIVAAVAACALVWIARFGLDKWTVVSGPTLFAYLVALFVGFGAAIGFYFCSLSSRSHDPFKNEFRETGARGISPGVVVWLLLLLLVIALIALAYIRVASEYLPGIDSEARGRVIAVTYATRWQNPCARALDVALDSGQSLHFCSATVWGKPIGSVALTPGDRVRVSILKTQFFQVVKNISRDSNE